MEANKWGEWRRSVEKVLNISSFFNQLTCDSFSITPRWLEYSVFNRMTIGRAMMSFAACFKAVLDTIRASQNEKYIYAYWSGSDAIAHEFGIASPQAKQHFGSLDLEFSKMLDKLAGTDTAVMLLSDQGFIDPQKHKQIQMAQHPRLKDCLMRPLCGEPRLSYCYVRHGGLFGMGVPHKELLPGAGDYMLVLKDILIPS